MTAGRIKPHDSKLLTDLDVDYAHFKCCGDEDLVFLRCPQCGHIWVECYECSTWYSDLNDLSRRESSFTIDTNERVRCPTCTKPFEDALYLKEGIVDRYTACLCLPSSSAWPLASPVEPSGTTSSTRCSRR